jgi:hypothetical protein
MSAGNPTGNQINNIDHLDFKSKFEKLLEKMNILKKKIENIKDINKKNRLNEVFENLHSNLLDLNTFKYNDYLDCLKKYNEALEFIRIFHKKLQKEIETENQEQRLVNNLLKNE